ncbi:MAG: SpvB/TcaC N-terminal domain-containing protein [Myxococcota bacterium]
MLTGSRWIALPSAIGFRFALLAVLVLFLSPSRGHAVGSVRLPEREDAPVEATVSESSGAFGYGIPIDVPPGPGGLVPQLSVDYSSHAGDGVAGVGWHLSASAIECSRRFGVPDFAACDRFELDGELLVGATDQGGGVTRYHTLNESFDRIRRFADGSWDVTTQDGTRRRYGVDAQSRYGTDGVTARWVLAEIVDVFGNLIEFTYTRFEPSGLPYLASVSYAGGTRSISFRYEDRPDVLETYSGGLREVLAKRLSEVIVYSGATLAVNHRLEFAYAAPGEYATERSRLASVTRFGTDCTTETTRPSLAGCVGLPPRRFAYTDLPADVPAQYVETSTAAIPSEITASIYASLPDYEVGVAYPDSYGVTWADVNGDGLDDLVRADCAPPCIAGQGTYKVFLGNGAGIDPVSDEDWADALAALRYEAPSLKLMKSLHENLSLFAGTSPYCVVQPSTFESGVYLGSTDDFVTPPQPISIEYHPNPDVPHKIREFAAPGNFRMADVDGDGLADLILSARIGGVWKTVGGDDCHVTYGDFHSEEGFLPDPVPAEFFMRDTQVVFLNQGPPVFAADGALVSGGWMRASEAGQPGLEEGLPPFVALAFRSHEKGGQPPGGQSSYPAFSVSCSHSGFEGDFDYAAVPSLSDDAAYLAALHEVGGYCRSFVDFDVQFVELNGDGRLDVVVLETENPRFIPNNTRIHTGTGEARPACPMEPGSFHGMGPDEGYHQSMLDPALYGSPGLGGPFGDRMPLFCSNPARSRAYVQADDGSGHFSWVPAPAFDLANGPAGAPEHHAYLYMLRANREGGAYLWNFPWHPSHFVGLSGFHVGDVGVRLTDLNGDGLTDVVWRDPFLDPLVGGDAEDTFAMSQMTSVLPHWHHEGGPTVANGVMLNTGTGWCASWSTGGDACPDAARYALPTHLSIAKNASDAGPLIANAAGGVAVEGRGVHLVDVNGDALVDVVRTDKALVETWVQSPGQAGANAWKRAPEFDPPAWAKAPLHIDGDGVLDWIAIPWDPTSGFPPYAARIPRYGLSQAHSPDHLERIENGRGGVFEVEYTPDAMQRDAALEASAEGQAATLLAGSTDPWNRTRWPMRSVVSKVSAAAFNFFAATSDAASPAPVVAETTYRYARPRWDDVYRTGMGFGLVESVAPDGTVTLRHYLQSHGLAGAMTQEVVESGGRPLSFKRIAYELVPGVPGAHPASFVGRPKWSLERAEYGEGLGEATGAERTVHFVYDDEYGYNFKRREITTRPSGGTRLVRVPPPLGQGEPTHWVIGHPVAESTYDDAWTLLASREIAYHTTSDGIETARVARVDRVDQPRGGTGVEPEAERYSVARAYDFRGNLVSETVDPDGTAHATTHCYDGDPGCPTGHGSHSLRVETTDALGNRSRTTLHPVLAKPSIEASDYIDVPGKMFAYDAFGRVTERYVVPEGRAANFGSATLLSSTSYSNTLPPVVTATRWTDDARSDSIQTITIGDGLGGTWKEIQRLPDGTGSGFTFSMTAEVRDPTSGWKAETLPIDCGPDSVCTAMSGLETPRRTTVSDALGRPVTGASPDGAFWLVEYDARTLSAGAPPSLAGKTFDRVRTRNRRGQLRISFLDADRLVRVEECDALTSPTSSTIPSCPADFEITHFTFEGSGEHRATFDANAASSNDWSSTGPHVLRLEYDTLGRVRSIVDPDRAAPLTTGYDARGLVEAETNARGQTRTHRYDAIGRLLKVMTPEEEEDVHLVYPAGQLQKSAEIALGAYWNQYFYDGLGRVRRTSTGLIGSMRTEYAYDLLGRQTKITHPIADGGVRTTVGTHYDGPFVRRICDLGAAADCFSPDIGQVYVDQTEYDAHGSLTAMAIAGGRRTYEYDPTTRYLTRDRFESGPAGSYWVQRLMKDPSTGAPAYDEVGNLLEVVGTSSASDFAFSTRHTFDEQGRVASWERVGEAGGVQPYGYDGIGNLVLNAGRVQAFEHEAHPHAISSRENDSVQYTYDADGNVATITDGSATRYFTFDSAGRMTCLGTVTGGCDLLDVTYELSGMRIKEVAAGEVRRYVGHDFQYIEGPLSHRKSIVSIRLNGARVATNTLVGGELAEVLPGTAIWVPVRDVLGFLMMVSLGGAMTLVLVGQRRGPRSWRGRIRSAVAASVAVQFATVPLAYAGGGAYPASSTVNWILSDAIGSALVELDASGDRVSHALYEPFGRRVESVGTGGVRYFAGHPYSEAAGLNYMIARWQDPEAGVFLSVDPLVPGEWDPQSYNAFAYARNNPISMNDPTGRAPFGFGIKTTQSISESGQLEFEFEVVSLGDVGGEPSGGDGAPGGGSSGAGSGGGLPSAGGGPSGVGGGLPGAGGGPSWASRETGRRDAAPGGIDPAPGGRGGSDVARAGVDGGNVPNVPIVPEPVVTPEVRARLRSAAILEGLSLLAELAADNLAPGPIQQAAEGGAGLLRVGAGMQMVAGGARMSAAGSVIIGGAVTHGNLPAAAGGALLTTGGVGLMGVGVNEMRVGIGRIRDAFSSGGSQ